MALIAPMDAVFLASETREQPMHVDGLHVFRLPEGSARRLCADAVSAVVGLHRTVADVPAQASVARADGRLGALG